MIQHDLKILSNNKIADETYEMVLEGGGIVDDASPGQFLHIKSHRNELVLRRPISIASVDLDSETLTILYKIVGIGTKAFTILKPGDIIDVLGPLGHGFEKLDRFKNKSVLVVGGGIGVAPLYELGKRLKNVGSNPTFILGFGTSTQIYYTELFETLGKIIITTDDGSKGIKGHVGTVLDTLKQEYEGVFACGPKPLLKRVQKEFSTMDDVYLSLEEYMACGIGACYACDTQDMNHRVCHDGPVFKAQEVTI